MPDKKTKEQDRATEKNLAMWLQGPIDEKEKSEIRRLLLEDPGRITDSFYTRLSFGTGGLRGIMGIGCNRMNQYTVQIATQGLANYLAKTFPEAKEQSIIIGFDSRRNSRFFAEIASRVLGANGIRAYLFKELCPTPLVSFGCRFKKCSGGIMITASHNPPEYNGYKVFWKDGGQVVPPTDQGIIAEIKAIEDLTQVKMAKAVDHPLIEFVGEEIFAAYLSALAKYPLYPEENKTSGASLSIVYTSLHGTGGAFLPRTLSNFGFENISLVKEQCVPDGDFPTVDKPNPEEPEALQIGINEMERRKADLLIATDPDADRMGVAVRHKEETRILSGNEVACICLYHICQALSSRGGMPHKAAFVKTIATTELFRVIAEHFGGKCFDVLTGFKYIAEKIGEWEREKDGYRYIFGGEESYGYLLGTHARDKDALVSSLLLEEAALHAKRQGKTLIDLLFEIYAAFGYYYDMLQSIEFEESKSGREKMASGILHLQENPPKSIAGIQVLSLEDYKHSVKIDLANGQRSPLDLPKSDAFLFWLEDRTKILVRPSGTEPKIKIYCGAVMEKGGDLFERERKLKERAFRYVECLKRFLENS